jgi:ubiquinone biosynthesis protein UbiJ
MATSGGNGTTVEHGRRERDELAAHLQGLLMAVRDEVSDLRTMVRGLSARVQRLEEKEEREAGKAP